MKRAKIIFRINILIAFACFLASCANPVSPAGGPKDETPPKVIKSEPPNFTVNFKKSDILITFNEFVKLKNPNQQVIISPPLAGKPEFKMRGKTVIINLNSTLIPNTTYSIFFGNSIVDLTEENPLNNYVYAFSTGDHIDSLAVGGEVLNAFDRKPVQDVFVMLYPQKNDTVPQDSVPCLVRPLYISKTDKNGIFQLRNLRNEPFKIFALKDVNSNYLFDQPNEEIAFGDSLILPEAITLPDFSIKPADTSKKDTLIVADLYKNYQHLLMFEQEDSKQRILSSEMTIPGRHRLVFKQAVEGKVSFEVINHTVPDDWKVEEFNYRRDTLLVWLCDPGWDSLRVQVSIEGAVLDTTMIVLRKQKFDKKKRKSDDDETVERIAVKSNAKSRSFDLGQQLVLNFDDPLILFDFTRTQLVAGTDTTLNPIFLPTNSLNRQFIYDGIFAEETNYEFLFPDSSFYSMYGHTNDSTKLFFTTKALKDYGNILMDIDLKSDNTPYILQLLTLKGDVLVEKRVTENSLVTFENITPGKYLLKAFYDKMPNLKWDTGNYFKSRQPEKVVYFPAEIEVRANWDIEKSWSLP